MELYEKIYVKPSFLLTEHGKITCQTCHKGDPEDPNWQTAHEGIIRDPTFPNADKTCGECHEDITPSAKNSLHYTLLPFEKVIKSRATKTNRETLMKISQAKDKHCSACHASCGQCHVSRPDYVEGGFLDGHLFKKTPPMDTTCASCHGGRVYAEFTGANDGYAADVHYAKEEMTCMHCHKGEEMHADATGVNTRFDLPERPKCEQCHPEVLSGKPKTKSHSIHRGQVACQVCHAIANKNCFSCHVGTDKKGLPYYKTDETKMIFKVGLNPAKTKDRPFEYVVLRHAPADPSLFDVYVRRGLTDFDRLPTWKLDTPHSIRRLTPQNKACNNCHSNANLFLRKDDVTHWEQVANAGVIVPDEKIPRPIEEAKAKTDHLVPRGCLNPLSTKGR